MQAMQKDVSRIQSAELVIEKINTQVSKIVQVVTELNNARVEGDYKVIPDMKTNLDSQISDLNKLAEYISEGKQDLMDGSNVDFVVGGDIVSLETMELSRDADQVASEILQLFQTDNLQDFQTDLPERISKFRQDASAIRSAIEGEVRDTIAKNMQESAATLPKDVYNAEKLLTDMRTQQKSSNPLKPDSDDQIDGKTINILK